MRGHILDGLGQCQDASARQTIGSIRGGEPQDGDVAHPLQLEELGRHSQPILAGNGDIARFNVGADELDDFVHRRAGLENRGYAGFFQVVDILIRNNAAYDQ